MKRLLLFFSFIGICFIRAYSFSFVAPSGQTLYAVVYGGQSVRLTYPGYYWSGYTKPSGNLIIPDSVIYNGSTYYVTRISSETFKGCFGLTSVTFPTNLNYIGDSAFLGCSGLTSITIPSTVSFIGKKAFGNCSQLSTVYFNAIACSMLLSSYPTTAPPFKNCNALTTVYFGDEVTTVPSSLFQDCTHLTSIFFNPGLSIGQCAFLNCTGLTSITLPDGVHDISAFAFKGCSNLVNITSISSIPPTIASISFNPFMNVPCNATIHIPCGSQSLYSSQWNYFSNFVEEFGYSINIHSSDYTMGTVNITEEATCFSPAVIVFASANSGYRFSQWSNGNIANPDTILLEGDSTVIAYFVPNQYSVSVQSNNESFGTVSGSGIYQEFDTVIIAANSFPHYHFVRWSDGNRDNPRPYIVTEDISLTAFFAIDTHTVTINSIDILRGMVNSNGTTFTYGQPCTVSATPYTGYVFSRWDNEITENPYTFAVLNDISLTAIFLPSYTISVASSNPSMGAVFGGGQFAEGETCTITATPNSGYQFDHWQDGNTDNPRNIVVTYDATYVAYFVPTQGIEDVDMDDVRVWTENNRIYVECANGAEIDVFNMVGHCVRNEALPAGVYMVRIGNHSTRKVVVIR